MPILALLPVLGALVLPAHAATPDAATPDAATSDAATTTNEVQPTAEQQAVYRALSARDQAPPCADLDKMSADPVATYLFIIDHAQQPPWAAMRAASCLMSLHAEQARPDIERWVVDPDTRGLAILAIDQLDTMPLDIATSIATKALTQGPDPEGMRKRISRATTPELRALADQATPLAPTSGQ